jgi:hypothetical protein
MDAELVARVRRVSSVVAVGPSLRSVTWHAPRRAPRSPSSCGGRGNSERAKRFDLRLPLVLIDIPPTAAGLDRAASLIRTLSARSCADRTCSGR